MSAQAKGETAAIELAIIQTPKAMIPIEIKNENAASMMTSIPTSERTASAFRRQSELGAGVCTENSNPDVMMVKPAEDWV